MSSYQRKFIFFIRAKGNIVRPTKPFYKNCVPLRALTKVDVQIEAKSGLSIGPSTLLEEVNAIIINKG